MKITVVIPIYNCEQYVDILLQQLVEQSYKDFEVIMINDGSTDKSSDICRKYQSMDERFRYYEYANEGVSSTRNKGISLAKGEYIIFFDADDRIDNDILYNLDKIACNTDADMIVFGYYMELLKNETVVQKTVFASQNSTLIYKDNASAMFMPWNNSLMYNVWNRMIKTNVIKDNSLQFDVNLSMGEDLDFILDVLGACNTVYISDKVMYHYIRERKGSATSNTYIKNWFEVRTEEKERLDSKFEKLGYYNVQYKNFLDKRYIERVIGCIENEFKHKSVGHKDRYLAIKKMIKSNEVQNTLSNEEVVYNSSFIKIIVNNMRKKNYLTLYFIGYISYFVRKNFLRLFMYLKNNR